MIASLDGAALVSWLTGLALLIGALATLLFGKFLDICGRLAQAG